MVNKQLISKYAKALYTIADKADCIKSVSMSIDQLCNYIQDIPELNYLLLSQRIDKNSKKKIINNIFDETYNELGRDLLVILIDNNDVSLLNSINKKLHYLTELHSKEMNATITSSFELSQDELDAIRDKISSKTGKKVTLDYKIDSNLLGGIKLRSENMVIDNSLLYRLNKIKESLIKS